MNLWAHDEHMNHPLAAQVQPLIDQWLASDEGIIAAAELEMSAWLQAS